ncbi:MAG: exopolysaccharide biosynthesis polyprenyl glycosylphosphotransferase [Candidatus Taylorbacteria bacterium]|nr:exopolysaccharide biosynthesis polyprenyl glycosylphosphotransferase [Candidatus Taylorbacteria bacterium]
MRKEPFFLLLGDLVLFVASLWLALFVRYGSPPQGEIFREHLAPFSILFGLSVLVFFIAGLYEKHTSLLKGKLPQIILRAQAANIALAVVFFYTIPYLEIAPKITLFIYLVFSIILTLWWRMKGFFVLGKRRKQRSILIGSGEEMEELLREVNGNARYPMYFVSSLNLDDISRVEFRKDILGPVHDKNVSIIVIDTRSEKIIPVLPHLYNLIFSEIRFIDINRVYEDIFDRVPLSLLRYNWFLENISFLPKRLYDFSKRAMDIVLSLFLGSLSLLIYPLIILALKLDDGGPIFFVQERVGRGNSILKIIKFRSMRTPDATKEISPSDAITRVGKFLRKSRLDELPQLWNVLKGDLSLIGPRPELPPLVALYEKEIPYYNIRHLLKPGLSGWAQLYHETPPKFDAHYEHTKTKLSYDLYYLKNRSFILDLKIVLRTLKVLLSRSGV